MVADTGIIQVIQMMEDGTRGAKIDSSSRLIPNPGKYFLAYEQNDPDSVLGWSLFPIGLNQLMDESSPPLLGPTPKSWNPGTQLQLRGPLGHGFQIPQNTRKLALAALGQSASRLLPLIHPSLEKGMDIAIFASTPLPQLPPAIEIHDLDVLKDNLGWADFLAVDIPADLLPRLRYHLGFDSFDRLTCQAQVLISIPMPCAGIGDCGACAVRTQRGGYKLICKDGPVLDLDEMDW